MCGVVTAPGQAGAPLLPDNKRPEKNETPPLSALYAVMVTGEAREGRQRGPVSLMLRDIWKIYFVGEGAPPNDALYQHAVQEKNVALWEAYLRKTNNHRASEANAMMREALVACANVALEQFLKGDYKAIDRREAQAAARVHHPNAVTIHDFGVSGDGLIYLVMEMVAGQSLRQWLEQSGVLSLADTASIIGQICAALDAAHEQGIVHRDIKPDNVIVNATTQGWQVKVLDFGIAKLTDLKSRTDQLTLTGSVIGTPHYMSPEQCMGEELDRRSDIYSLGVLLYELLTGEVPFSAPTWSAIIVKHVNEQPQPPSVRNPGSPSAVDAVVLGALAKRREDRPQSAGMLARQLALSISGGGSGGSGSFPVHQPLPSDTPTYNPVAAQPHPVPARPTPAPNTPAQGGSRPGGAENFEPTKVVKMPTAVLNAHKTPPHAAAHDQATRKAPLWAVAALAALLICGGVWLALRNDGDSPPASPEPPAGMVYIPGGEVTIGNNAGDDYERPAHNLSLPPFFIDKCEVTCEDYQKFLVAAGRAAPPDWPNGNYQLGAGRRPVTGVTWDDAEAYAQWAGKRLPTETEWEAAARGADGRRYPWGNEWKSGHANADASSIDHLADAGSHPAGASPFGVLDLAGNAWEWTASDLTAYPGGQLPRQELSGDLKVIRGGAWDSNRQVATTTYRRGYPARGFTEYSRTGFRCAKDAPRGER
ncbi:MAG: bifunctional serine/threonine-protein kinase/formylglycine-generating enzyme family protein [Blastocatellia bacterium]